LEVVLQLKGIQEKPAMISTINLLITNLIQNGLLGYSSNFEKTLVISGEASLMTIADRTINQLYQLVMKQQPALCPIPLKLVTYMAIDKRRLGVLHVRGTYIQ
jgi:hypothetical protein